MEISIVEDVFGKCKVIDPNEGDKFELIRRFTLSNQNGIYVQVINYGATITSLNVPDKNGHIEDIVLGFDTVEEYVNHPCYFGATIGRCANRIANGKFIINNREYSIAKNEGGKNHLHGGNIGFDKVVWDSHVKGNLVTFSYNSQAMEEGYPGMIQAQVSFELTPQNELIILYEVQDVTETTIVNMTNHSYFNLAGHGAGTINNHRATILSDTYLPLDNNNIPTGEIASVSRTVFDLRTETVLSQLHNVPGGGFDHNYCLKYNVPNELRTSAIISEPNSGRKLEVSTNQPGIQFYTSNFLPTDTSLRGKAGALYQKHGAFCLETQNYPNAINKKNFPSCLIQPGEIYSHKTIFKFTTVNSY